MYALATPKAPPLPLCKNSHHRDLSSPLSVRHGHLSPPLRTPAGSACIFRMVRPAPRPPRRWQGLKLPLVDGFIDRSLSAQVDFTSVFPSQCSFIFWIASSSEMLSIKPTSFFSVITIFVKYKQSALSAFLTHVVPFLLKAYQ
jgi:hypothetical protein